MSEDLTQQTSSENAVVEETSVPTQEVAQEAAPTVNETELILAGLEKQFSEIDVDTVPTDKKSAKEEPSTIEPATTEEETDEYDAEELYNSALDSPRSTEIETLKAQLAEMQNQLKQVQSSPNAPQTQGQGKKPYEILPLINPEEYRAILEDEKGPEYLNRILNRAMYTGYEMATARASTVAAEVANNIIVTQNSINQYLTANADLRQHEKLMSLVWRDVAAKAPDKSLPELLNEVGNETRRILKSRPQKKGQLRSEKKERPAFARPSGGGNRGGGTPNPNGKRGWDW